MNYPFRAYLGKNAHVLIRASLGAQMVKNLLVMQTQVHSLDQKDPLQKRMATHSCILTWSIPCTEEPGGLQSIMGLQKVGHN